MSPSCFEPTTLGFLAGHLVRLAIGTVDYMCFKLLQYSEVTGNAWIISKPSLRYKHCICPCHKVRKSLHQDVKTHMPCACIFPFITLFLKFQIRFHQSLFTNPWMCAADVTPLYCYMTLYIFTKP